MEGKQRGVQSVSGCSRECHYFFLKYAKQVNLHPQGSHGFESHGSSSVGLLHLFQCTPKPTVWVGIIKMLSNGVLCTILIKEKY